jgi:hypothetical protein
MDLMKWCFYFYSFHFLKTFLENDVNIFKIYIFNLNIFIHELS